VCAVLGRCDERAPKTAAPKAPLKITRASHRVSRRVSRVSRVAASRKANVARKVSQASKASKASKAKQAKQANNTMGAKGARVSILTPASLDNKTANIKVVISRLSLARGHPIVARSWVIRMPRSVL
jgi:hypothetical protein